MVFDLKKMCAALGWMGRLFCACKIYDINKALEKWNKGLNKDADRMEAASNALRSETLENLGHSQGM